MLYVSMCLRNRKSHLVNSAIFYCLTVLLFISCGPAKEKELVKEIEYYHFHQGSKGAVAWKLEGEWNEEKSAINLSLVICSDIKKRKMNRIPLLACSDLEEAIFIQAKFARAIFKGDRCILILPQKGFLAFNIYSGELLESGKDIAMKFPQLKDGVSSAEYYNDSYNIVQVIDKNQKIYYYDTNQSLLFPSDQKYWVDSLVDGETLGFT
ncbi:MAG: hypothetical protein IAF38_00685, partial [Bacteroidia bacterium]|nr:hypothetical protein [Bacteroidia bacterium]